MRVKGEVQLTEKKVVLCFASLCSRRLFQEQRGGYRKQL